MAMSSWSRSSGATICARAAPDGDFKACCLDSGRHDGANRQHYFQGVTVRGLDRGAQRRNPGTALARFAEFIIGRRFRADPLARWRATICLFVAWMEARSAAIRERGPRISLALHPGYECA